MSGKASFWVLAIVLVIGMALTVERMPARVASHFDASGRPNGWSGRTSYALLLLGVGTLLPLGCVGMVHALTRRGPARLNLPGRDHWLRPEHAAEAVRRVRAHMWWLGCVMAAAALIIHVLVLQANRADPPRLRNDHMLLAMGAILLGIGGWAVAWYRLLRPPARR